MYFRQTISRILVSVALVVPGWCRAAEVVANTPASAIGAPAPASAPGSINLKTAITPLRSASIELIFVA